jgi:DNA polymerase III subunit delta
VASCKGHEVEAFLQRRTSYPITLVYGPNTGLVHERARTLAHAAIPDPTDSFQLVRLEGDELAADPARLADEANTIGLFGGKRALWIRAGSRNFAPAVQPLLAAPAPDSCIVIEAGDLAGRNPLRTAVEGSRNGMALPCFADEPRDLAPLIDGMLREAGLSIARDARDAVIELVGADRMLTRREIEKLALYAGGQGTVTLADVEAVMADASALVSDAVIDAAFTGQIGALDAGVTRLFAEGEDAGVVAGSALRHAMTLHRTRSAVDRGTGMDTAILQARIFFKRKAAFQRQLTLWSATALDGVITLLRDTQLQARRQPALGETQLARALLMIATRVARR